MSPKHAAAPVDPKPPSEGGRVWSVYSQSPEWPIRGLILLSFHKRPLIELASRFARARGRYQFVFGSEVIMNEPITHSETLGNFTWSKRGDAEFGELECCRG